MTLMLTVLVLSADVGEGHLAAARAITEGLQQRDVDVVERDGLIALGRPARHVIRDGYRLQLRLAPWTYSLMYLLFNHVAISRRMGEVLLSWAGRRRLLALVDAVAPDVVVSTHPALTCVLGRARRRRRLAVPLVASITDMADYAIWSHRGADVHLVMHQHAVGPVERVAGPGSAVLVAPLVAARFRVERDTAAARRALALPEHGPVVVVSGGGWGVGDLAGGVEAGRECGAAAVVVVAGRNHAAEQALSRRFASDLRVTVLGFTTRMDELMRAADVLIHSTGGVTSLEALSCGCPMIAFGASAGHMGVHNATMASLGLIAVADTSDELRALLRTQLACPPAVELAPEGAEEAAVAIVGARRRVRQLPAWRLALASAAARLAMAGLAYVSLTVDEAYSVAARPLDARPTTHVRTARPGVAIVVRGSGSDAPVVARLLGEGHVPATFAVAPGAVSAVADVVASQGDDVVPALPTAAAVRWVRTRGTIAHAPRLGGRRVYLAPDDGLSFGQYLLARTAGATAIAGRIRYSGSGVTGAREAPRFPVGGDIVVLTPDGSPQRTVAELRALSASLARHGLEAVTLSTLLSSSSSSAATSERTAGERSSATAPPTITSSPTTTSGG
jgi:UDP-N-acetylglucosamine:LPS N-acetylglucosamine transferase